MALDADQFATALRQYAAGVCLLTVRDDIDDVGTTVSSVMSVSADPPLIAVGLDADGYPAEVLEAVGVCGLTVLGAGHARGARVEESGGWGMGDGGRVAGRGRNSTRHFII